MQLRKIQIAQNLSQLILQNPDYTVSELINAIYRRKNFVNKDVPKLHWEADDEELSRAIELTIQQISKEDKEEA